ncbi:hypothetical protein AMK59_7638 [Oryctes borbonicus]|uniref:CCHC-type domain-containing protein n=1 Tax=Oryctes borbonicus TaxID=1629725 RepID=A0A0T6AXF1_9SCAR|nr:hypothetical protein AMK59_7638 [Oryctes borbonicus]
MTALNNKNSFNVELLNSNNYHTWKFRMHTLLTELDVIECLDQEFKAENYTEEKERNAGKKKDNKCKSVIVQCLDDTQIDLVRDEKTAFSMWKNLENRYEKKGIPGQLALRRKLMSIKLTEPDNLEVFLGEFDNIIRQLKATGAEVKDEDIVCNLLLAMPKEFDTVVTILENLPASELTLDAAKAKLRAEIEKKRASNVKQDKVEGKPATFFTHRDGCYLCGEKGHYKRDCKKFGQRSFRRNNEKASRGRSEHGNSTRDGYQGNSSNNSSGNGFSRNGHRGCQASGHRGHYGTGQRGNRRGRSNFVEREEKSDDIEPGICFMSNVNISDSDTLSENELLFCIDSGCTDHLVNNEKYFSELLMLKEPIQIAVAKSNNYMNAVGVGIIKVKSKINNEEIDCTIKNVFYVPNLRRNLLSVKRLGQAEIKVVFDSNEVKLYSKTRKLIGIGHRDNLYEISFKVTNNECVMECMSRGYHF